MATKSLGNGVEIMQTNKTS